MSRHATEAGIWTADKPMRRCTGLLAIRRMETKTMARSYETSIRMAKWNSESLNTACWWGCRCRPSYAAVVGRKMVVTVETDSYKTKWAITTRAHGYTAGRSSLRKENCVGKNTYTGRFLAAVLGNSPPAGTRLGALE